MKNVRSLDKWAYLFVATKSISIDVNANIFQKKKKTFHAVNVIKPKYCRLGQTYNANT